MGAVEDTVRGLGCLAKGGGVIAVVIIAIVLVLALFNFLLDGAGKAAGGAMDFYAAHCDTIWAIIGVVFILFVARHLGKKR